MYVNTRSHKLCAITIISSASSLEGRNEILIDTHIEPKPNALPVILCVCMCADSVCNLPLARITCLFVIKLTLNLIFFRLFIRWWFHSSSNIVVGFLSLLLSTFSSCSVYLFLLRFQFGLVLLSVQSDGWESEKPRTNRMHLIVLST